MDQVVAGLGHLNGLLRQLSLSLADDGCDQADQPAIMALPELCSHLGEAVLPQLGRAYGIAIDFAVVGDSNVRLVANTGVCARIADNLIANAVRAQATRVRVTVAVRSRHVELTFTDNGHGMTETQVSQLGFGFTTKGESGHGQGFRIVRKLAADLGGAVAPPKSIQGFATEICVALMKVTGAAAADVAGDDLVRSRSAGLLVAGGDGQAR